MRIGKMEYNTFYHNNFLGNTHHAGTITATTSENIFDNGYPSGGNYWSDYTGDDNFKGPDQDIPGSDFIGDDWYVVNENNTDHYPLMIPYETNPPTVDILSPENRTYTVNASIPLTFTVDGFTTWISYSLDEQANVPVVGNTTLPTLPDGLHQLTLYANGTLGNMGLETIHFTVDTIAPNISDVVQDPLSDILPDTVVKINATVTDATTGVGQVMLNCTFTNSTNTWYAISNMTHLAGDSWNGTILSLPYGTNVTYVIVAEDTAGNAITTEQVYGPSTVIR